MSRYSFYPSEPEVVLSSSRNTNFRFTIEGPLTQRTELYDIDMTHINDIVAVSVEEGKGITYEIEFKEFAGQQDTVGMAFDLVYTDGTTERTGTYTITVDGSNGPRKGITTVPRIVVDDSITVGSTSGTSTMSYWTTASVLSSTVKASVSNGKDWLSVTGTGNGSVSFSFTKNTGSTQRAGTITLNAETNEGTLCSSYFIVYQNAGESEINGTITPLVTTMIIPSEGKSGSLTFASVNIDEDSLTVYSDCGWVDIVSFNSRSFAYEIGKNNESTRTGKVVISAKNKYNDNYAYAYVSFQQACVKDSGSIDFEDEQIEIGYEAKTTYQTIEYTYRNISSIHSCTSSESWLSLGSGSEDLGGPVRYTVTENQGARRTAVISIIGISSIDGSYVADTVTVIQDKRPGYIEDEGSINIQSMVYTGTFLDSEGSVPYTLTDVVASSVEIESYDGNVTNCHLSGSTLYYAVSKNEVDDVIISSIRLQATTSRGSSISAVVGIVQDASPETVEFPIWKDTLVTIESDDTYVDYVINIGADTVFSGRAYMNNGKCDVWVNKIMKNFLEESIDISRVNGIQDNNAYINAEMHLVYDGVYSLYKYIKTYNDWSYNDEKVQFLSDPVSSVMDSRQLFVCSVIDYADNLPILLYTTTAKNGKEQKNVYTLYNQIGTLVKPLNDVTSITAQVGDERRTYTVKDTCNKYCLYYKNKKGGYEFMLFGGSTKQTDKVNIKSFKRLVKNTLCKHSKVQYQKDITETWTLKTPYLSDEQSEKVSEIMLSNDAYLHILDDDRIIPVNVTTTSVNHLTFKNNGRKMARYDITVENSQDRFIR